MKKVNITCLGCGVERFTFSRTTHCVKCVNAKTNAVSRDRLRATMAALGLTNIEEVGANEYGKTSFSFVHPTCGTRQTWTTSNLNKQLNLRPTIAPCSTCGKKERAAKGTAGYIAKYGLDPARIGEWEVYRKTVRSLTEHSYRQHKDTINPLNLQRSMDGWHLDHRTPIIQGFLAGTDAKVIAHHTNLQLLTATENLSKGGRT